MKRFPIFLFLLSALIFPGSARASETGQAQQLQQLQEGQAVDSRFADYFKKLTQSPNNPQVHLELAEIYLERNLLELAVVSFRRSLALQPGLARAHFGLSKTYRKKKLKKHELVEMENAVLVEPDNLNYRYELGVLYMEPANFDYKKAKKQYKVLKKALSPLADPLGVLMQIDS